MTFPELEDSDDYGRRFGRLLDRCERALARYFDEQERKTPGAEEMYAVVKDFSMTLRRLQEGRESFHTELQKLRERDTGKSDASANADATATADAQLRAACERDAGRFAREFFPEHCRLPFSPLHRWMLREYDRRARLAPPPAREGRNLAIAAPRGHAKSTIQSLVLPIHSLVYGRERYIVILSATLKQSRQRLAAIAGQLKRNAALRRVFPSGERGDERFAADSIETGGARIDAYSAGSEFRGVTFGQFRPTHIILDDAEDSESVESAELRDKLAEWFNEVVENLGNGYTNITVVGTLLHPHSLLAGLMSRPDFKSWRFRAVRSFARREDLWEQWRALYTDLRDPARAKTAQALFNHRKAEMLDGARALWPEKESYYKLMIQLATRGRRAFFQEKQNDPRLAEVTIFDPARMKYFRLERDALVLEDGAARVALEELRVAGFLDVAMGKTGVGGGSRAGDFAALVTVGMDAHGLLYVLDARVERARPSEQARWVFDLFERWNHAVIGVEGNCFQELMLGPIEDERKRRRADGRPWQVAVEAVHQRAAKDARIRALEALVETGALRFARGLNERFVQQLEGYPARHDDGPDALAGAVELARAMAGAGGRPLRRSRDSQRPIQRY